MTLRVSFCHHPITFDGDVTTNDVLSDLIEIEPEPSSAAGYISARKLCLEGCGHDVGSGSSLAHHAGDCRRRSGRRWHLAIATPTVAGAGQPDCLDLDYV